MRLENLALSKDFSKSIEESNFISHDSFESALKQMENFNPIIMISRKQVRIDQAIEDGGSGFLGGLVSPFLTCHM